MNKYMIEIFIFLLNICFVHLYVFDIGLNIVNEMENGCEQDENGCEQDPSELNIPCFKDVRCRGSPVICSFQIQCEGFVPCDGRFPCNGRYGAIKHYQDKIPCAEVLTCQKNTGCIAKLQCIGYIPCPGNFSCLVINSSPRKSKNMSCRNQKGTSFMDLISLDTNRDLMLFSHLFETDKGIGFPMFSSLDSRTETNIPLFSSIGKINKTNYVNNNMNNLDILTYEDRIKFFNNFRNQNSSNYKSETTNFYNRNIIGTENRGRISNDNFEKPYLAGFDLLRDPTAYRGYDKISDNNLSNLNKNEYSDPRIPTRNDYPTNPRNPISYNYPRNPTGFEYLLTGFNYPTNLRNSTSYNYPRNPTSNNYPRNPTGFEYLLYGHNHRTRYNYPTNLRNQTSHNYPRNSTSYNNSRNPTSYNYPRNPTGFEYLLYGYNHPTNPPRYNYPTNLRNQTSYNYSRNPTSYNYPRNSTNYNYPRNSTSNNYSRNPTGFEYLLYGYNHPTNLRNQTSFNYPRNSTSYNNSRNPTSYNNSRNPTSYNYPRNPTGFEYLLTGYKYPTNPTTYNNEFGIIKNHLGNRNQINAEDTSSNFSNYNFKNGYITGYRSENKILDDNLSNRNPTGYDYSRIPTVYEFLTNLTGYRYRPKILNNLNNRYQDENKNRMTFHNNYLKNRTSIETNFYHINRTCGNQTNFYKKYLENRNLTKYDHKNDSTTYQNKFNFFNNNQTDRNGKKCKNRINLKNRNGTNSETQVRFYDYQSEENCENEAKLPKVDTKNQKKFGYENKTKISLVVSKNRDKTTKERNGNSISVNLKNRNRNGYKNDSVSNRNQTDIFNEQKKQNSGIYESQVKFSGNNLETPIPYRHQSEEMKFSNNSPKLKILNIIKDDSKNKVFGHKSKKIK